MQRKIATHRAKTISVARNLTLVWAGAALQNATHTRAQPFPSPTHLLKYSLCYLVKRSSLRSLPVVAMASSSAFVPKHDVRCGSPGAKRWLPPSFRWSHSLCPIGDAQGYDLNEARMESVFIGISGLIGAGKVRW